MDCVYHLGLVLSCLNHYFCSSKSLTKYRNISPIDVLILKKFPESSDNKEVFDLSSSINRFESALFLLNKNDKITLELLIQVNAIVLDKANSKLRRVSLQLGNDGESTQYVCPSYKDVHKLLNQLVSCINREKHSLNNVLYYFFRLVAIHPFEDGNGRTARALFSSLVSKQLYNFYCPFLHHTQANRHKFHKLVCLSENREKFQQSEELAFFKRLGANKTKQYLIDQKALKRDKLKMFPITHKERNELRAIYKELETKAFITIEQALGNIINKEVQVLEKLLTSGALSAQKSRNGQIYIFSELVIQYMKNQHFINTMRN